MTGLLKGRRAYVTGGSSGIGAAIVEAFAAEGAHVAIGASTHGAAAQETAARLNRKGQRAIVAQADLSKRAEAERAADEVLRGLGGLDIFVHSAGIDITKSAPTHRPSVALAGG